MTDNEKRAHDLAVAASVDACHMHREVQILNGEKQIHSDYFTAYMDIYENAIKIFNEKFPNGK